MLTDLRMSLEALVAGEASVDETECDILNLPEFRQSDAAEIARLREEVARLKDRMSDMMPIAGGNPFKPRNMRGGSATSRSIGDPR